MNANHILVFDSGVGGLSICSAIIQRCPSAHITYISDNAAFPYGEKTAQQVITRASEVIHSAYLKHQPDIVVIACNTASTVVLPSVRAELPIPVVGVVPAIKPAAQLSHSKTFALIATPGTISRVYTAKLIAEFAGDCKVISVGSSELVRAIERSIHGEPLDESILRDIVAECNAKDSSQAIDVAILGCTHFPLVVDQFRKLKPQWMWIDSGEAIASRVNSLLAEINRPNVSNDIDERDDKAPHEFWQTAATSANIAFNQFLNDRGFLAPQHYIGV